MSENSRSFSTLLKFSGVHLGAVGAKTSFLADAGPLAAVLEVTGRPKVQIPACTLKNLRVRAPTNTLAANLVVTVMKNGVATAITATITTGSTALFKDTAHAVAFAADDEIDLQLDSTAGGVGNSGLLVATLEVG